MADDFIGIDVSGMDAIQAKLSELPAAVGDSGVELANEYLVNVLRAYPPRVQHGTDNPYMWNTERQRRAFFATDGFGRGIPTQRTQELSQGWKTLGNGVNQIIVNEAESAPYVVGDQMQHGHVADGWTHISITLKEREPQILRKFEAGIKNAIRKLGLD